jgi:hypothetical protein
LVGSLAREEFEGTESRGKAGPTRKGDITSGKIKGKVIYRPTGEPVAYAQIESLNIKTGGRMSCSIRPKNEIRWHVRDRYCESNAPRLGSRRILDPDKKALQRSVVKEIWDTAGQDLWVIQSPLKTFIITKE